jgi:drug/metabolite transporter (DMT)-like permease
LTTLAGTLLAGCALDLPLALMTATNGDWARVANASSTAWLGLAHLTLVVSLFGLASQNMALRHVEASQLAVVGNAAPILTILWGVWLLGESFTPALAIGGLLTLAGIVWSSRVATARVTVRRRSLAA